MLHGIDVHRRYQGLMDYSKIPELDFVITKCTGGTGLIIEDWQSMLKGVKLTGVYHYARERGCQGTAKQEAESFIRQAKLAPEDAVLVLDWEESFNTNLADTAWVQEWCELVEKALGRRPVIYTGNAVLSQNYVWWDWSNKNKYFLWYARYPSTKPVGWQSYDKPNVPNWPNDNVCMWQYSSAGGVPGWPAALDLNIFYGDEAFWYKIAGVNKTEEEGEGMSLSAKAISWAKSMVGKSQYGGMCEAFVRTSFGFSAKYATATLAWQASKAAGAVHTNSYNAPAGVPVFWGLTYNAAGHVALSIGNGKAISTSNKYGTPGICVIDIADYSKNAVGGTTYRGWAEVYHGTRVYSIAVSANTKYKGHIDGKFGPMTIESLQHWLKARKYYTREINSLYIKETWKAVQRWLTKDKYYDREIDGVAGYYTVYGVQSALKAAGYYTSFKLDGYFGKETIKAWQSYLAKHA